MSNNFRVTQHKPAKEGISPKEFAELKRELRQCKRTVSRLQKELAYFKARMGQEEVVEEPRIQEQEIEQKPETGCCEAEALAFVIRLPSGVDLFMCSNCGKRTKKDPEP